MTDPKRLPNIGLDLMACLRRARLRRALAARTATAQPSVRWTRRPYPSTRPDDRKRPGREAERVVYA